MAGTVPGGGDRDPQGAEPAAGSRGRRRLRCIP
jgi:hypothetical protein